MEFKKISINGISYGWFFFFLIKKRGIIKNNININIGEKE